MGMSDIIVNSFLVNRPVRTRMPGGVGLGVKSARLPVATCNHPNANLQ
jgi:hypothetical protein